MDFILIREAEEEILDGVMDENDLVLSSTGNIVDGKLIVDEGPLKGLVYCHVDN